MTAPSLQLPVSFGNVDRWFAMLRVLVVVGGLAWLLVGPIDEASRTALSSNFAFFTAYSLALYILILRFPLYLKTLYLIALFLDLGFLHGLVRLTGGLQSEFFLAFFLLIALHSFYFGLWIGLGVVLASSLVYLLAGSFAISSVPGWKLVFRLTLFLIVGLSMGLLSRRERQDRRRIRKLNEQLEKHRGEIGREKEKLEQIVLGIGAALILVNRDMRIEWVNPIAELWFGSAEELHGKPCAAFLWSDGGACQTCPAELSFQDGGIHQGETELQHRGQRRLYRLTSAPILDHDGRVDRVLELVQDITQEKTTQEQLIQSSKLAAIGELASGVAHEINNPLSSIAVCIEELAGAYRQLASESNAASASAEECIRCIKDEIQRCKRTTTGLLSFSQRRDQHPEPLDINQVLTNTSLLVTHRAADHGLQLQFDLDPELPLVMAESDGLSQVFLNLFINAIDFARADTEIVVRSRLAAADAVSVAIEDRGCGIAARDLPRIFEPFFTTKSAGRGTGLGLAISQKIVQRHHGRIAVRTRVDEGTVVTVTIPVDAPVGAVEPGRLERAL